MDELTDKDLEFLIVMVNKRIRSDEKRTVFTGQTGESLHKRKLKNMYRVVLKLEAMRARVNTLDPQDLDSAYAEMERYVDE